MLHSRPRQGRQEPNGRTVHLHDAEPAEGGPAPARDPPRHLPFVLPGRQDRHPRSERRRQVHGAPHHGGARQGVHGRGVPGRGDAHRVPFAGPAARPEEDRPRERRGGRRAGQEAARALRRAGREDGREPAGRRDGKGHGRVRQGAGRHRGRERLGPRPHARDRDGRAALSAARRGRHEDLGRREAARGALPPPPPEERHAPPRRAHEPPRRRVRRVARAVPEGIPGHGRRRHARPLLPRQRRRLDPRAGPRRGHPVEGQLLLVARAEGSAPRDRGEDRIRAPALAQARARVGAHGPARAAGQEQGAPAGVRAARLGKRHRGARRDERDLHSAGPAPRRRRRARRGREEVLRRQAPLRRPDASTCRRAASSGSSGRTAPARRRSSR